MSDVETRRRAIGMHIYSGSFTLGMSEHYSIGAQLEEGPWGASTFKLNFPRVRHPMKLRDWHLSREYNRTEVMYANPPCAPWSGIGGRKGLRDPRIEFTRNCFDAALEVQPDFFVLESVCRAFTQGRIFYEEYGNWFKRCGYAVTYFLTNVLLHGGCQWRERFHIIAHKFDLDWQEPEQLKKPPKTVDQAIGDLEFTAALYQRNTDIDVINDCNPPNHCVRAPRQGELLIYNELSADENYNETAQKLIDAGKKEVRKGRLISGRLHGNCAAKTIVDVGVLIHPRENRLITLREGMRLCDYPDHFVIAPDRRNHEYGAAPTDVTQVVLPTMGRYFGNLFRRSREQERVARAGAHAVIDWRAKARNMSPGRWAKKLKKIALVNKQKKEKATR